MRTERSRTGFTLTELLVATAILVIFGGMAVASLRYGSDLWRSCHRRSHGYNVATIIFHQLEDDIGGAKGQFWGRDADAFDTRVKFYVDYDRYFQINYGYPFDPYLGRQRLRFVRGIPEDTVNPLLRQAGDGTDNDDDWDGVAGHEALFVDEEYYNLQNDPQDADGDGDVDYFPDTPDQLVDEDLMALEGMYEVAYLMGLDVAPGSWDANTLYRAVLAPIGERMPVLIDPSLSYPEGWNVTLFDGNYIGDDPADTAQQAAARVRCKAAPLANGILHFEVRCWTQYTTIWDTVGLSTSDVPPSLAWDSDRLSDDPANPPNPYFFMDWGEPGYDDVDSDADGELNSVDPDYVRDNVFPRSIMVVVVVDPSEEYPDQNPLRLAQPILAGRMDIPVVGTAPAYNDRWPYILIQDPDKGDEWIRFSHFEPNTNTFVVDPAFPRTATSLVRGTPAVNHNATQADGRPTLVKLGYTFSRVFHNPAGKEH